MARLNVEGGDGWAFRFPVVSGQFVHQIRMFEGSAPERISQHGRRNAGVIISRAPAEPQVNFLLTRRPGDGTFPAPLLSAGSDT